MSTEALFFLPSDALDRPPAAFGACRRHGRIRAVRPLTGVIALVALAVVAAPGAYAQKTPAAPAPAAPATPTPAAPTPVATPPAPATTRATTPAAEGAAETPAEVAEKPRLLVTELKNQGASDELVAAINAAIASQAKASFAGEVTSTQEVRAKLELSSQKLLSGCSDDNCYFDAAKVIGAEKVLGGSVSKVGDDLLVNVIVINGRDGTRVTQVQRKTPPLQELAIYTAAQSTAIALVGAPTTTSVPVVVRIRPGPTDALVRVDGEERGAPPVTLSLAPGSHDIEIRASAVAPYRTTLTVEAGSPILIEAKLGSDNIELWPVAVGMGAASVVTLAAGLAFGAFAQLNYDGTVAGLPLGNPDDSYLLKSPATSVELAEKEQTISQLSLASNVLTLGVVPILAAGAVGFLVAYFVLGAGGE